MLFKILSIIVLATQVLVGASFASDKTSLGGGGLAAPTVPVPAKFREFSDFCITEKWKFHLACLRNKDDAPRWIQDNYEKDGKVAFYEESIWRYIPKAIIDVCCDGKSDILPGVHANAFSPANWRALLLKKSIAQCLKYLQSGKTLFRIAFDLLDAIDDSIEVKLLPMGDEILYMKGECNKKEFLFVEDAAKKYGLTGKLPPLKEGESFFVNDYQYWQRYFNKIGRSEDVDSWMRYMKKLKYPEEIYKMQDKINEIKNDRRSLFNKCSSDARQTLFDSYNIPTNIDKELKHDKINKRYFIKLAADELKADVKYSSFVSDIEAAFDDIAIYTETLDVFDFINKEVLRACPDNSGSGYFSCGNGQAVLLHDFLDKFGNVNHSFCNAKYPFMSKIFASWFDERDIAGRLKLRADRVYDSQYRRYYDYRKLFFKNFPEQYEYSEVPCPYFFNGKVCYSTSKGLVLLDDKMNFVKEITEFEQCCIYDVLDGLIGKGAGKLCCVHVNILQEDHLDDMLLILKNKWNRDQEKIRADIEALEKDKTKTEELKEYKSRLGAERARSLFWMLFENEKYDVILSRAFSSSETVDKIKSLLRQIKELGLDADFDFLGKDAIRLGELDPFFQYEYEKASTFREQDKIIEKRWELRKFVNEFVNTKLSSGETLKRLLTKATQKGVIEHKFPDGYLLGFASEITYKYLEIANYVDRLFKRIEAFMPSPRWAWKQLEESVQQS